jgi:hypothetical protein
MSLFIFVPSANRNTLKALAILALYVTAGVLTAQTSVLLPATRDVPIGYHDNYPSANLNYNSGLLFAAYSQTGFQGGENNNRSLVDFDLSILPAGSTLLGAFLNLTAVGPFSQGPVGSVGSTGQNSCTLRRVTEEWNDATVTWNNQPANTLQNAVPLPQSTHPLQNYYSINVTALVRDMIADPANSHGFMLMLDDETPERGLVFHSGMAQRPDQRPTLLLVYGECGTVGMSGIDNAVGELVVSPSIASAGEIMVLSMPGALEQPARLEVVDAAGRLVWNTTATQWPVQWKVPAPSRGSYTLIVKGRTGEVLGAARAVIR